MEEQHPNSVELISNADWEQMPVSAKRLVRELTFRVTQLEEQLGALQTENELLREQLKRTSANSSQPPSQDPPKGFKPSRRNSSGKKRGGQAGHEGHGREFYPMEECYSITAHYPEVCWKCGERLEGEDPQPYRHQIVEIPPVVAQVEEHQFHQLECPVCGCVTRAWDEEMLAHGYGVGVVAQVAVLSSLYRHSQRMVQQALQDLFGVKMSLGSVNQLRQEASMAVAEVVKEAHEYVQQHPVVGMDETSFVQGNSDGNNPQHHKGWLWVMVTPLVSYFQVWLSRSQAAAQNLLGRNFWGILTTDRYSAYTWLAVSQRQVCWAHLKRDFTQIAERTGASAEIGKALLEQEKSLFGLWYQVRDGTLSRWELSTALVPIRARVYELLSTTASAKLGAREKTPWAKTVRTCRQLLQVEPALWLFVTVEGVEPTNNAAERAIRPAVLWRRTSFGAQSQAGSLFVARMLTVVTTLRSQNRNVLDYLTQACLAARAGTSAPSLLPALPSKQEQDLPAALTP